MNPTAGARRAAAAALILTLAGAGGCGSDDTVIWVDPSPRWSWTAQESGTTDPINAVFSLDENHAWAVGMHGMVLFYDGTSWSQQTVPQQAEGVLLWSVFAVDPAHVWAVGSELTILFYDGSDWSLQHQVPGIYNDFKTVFALSATTAMAGSGVEGIFTTDNGGTSWEYQATGGYPCGIDGITALGTRHVWAAGSCADTTGAVLFYDGVFWELQKQTLSSLLSIDVLQANSQTYLWAVGRDALIAFYDGFDWVRQASGLTADQSSGMYLRGVAASSLSGVLAVGDRNVVLYYDGNRWVRQTGMPVAADMHYFGVSFIDPNRAWVVGEDGTILLGTLGR